MNIKAKYFRTLDNKVQCVLCPHNCILTPNKFGKCNVRFNNSNVLTSTNYGEITAIALDPIEKKPLYHFYPGSKIISVGSYGCNLKCKFCQNYNIAHYHAESKFISCVSLSEIITSSNDSIGLAFTYNEPIVSYEYVLDTARYIKRHSNKKIVLVTNGFINIRPLSELIKYIDAINIDLKAFNDNFYREVCRGSLDEVKATIEFAASTIHTEVTTLIIDGLNNSDSETLNLARFLSNINRNIPLHLTRYYPSYKLNKPATSINSLKHLQEICLNFLNYVYIGNIGKIPNTYCHSCKYPLVKRNAYQVKINTYNEYCPECNSKHHIVT